MRRSTRARPQLAQRRELRKCPRQSAFSRQGVHKLRRAARQVRSPVLLASLQAEGAFVQGLGLVLSEHVRHDPDTGEGIFSYSAVSRALVPWYHVAGHCSRYCPCWQQKPSVGAVASTAPSPLQPPMPCLSAAARPLRPPKQAPRRPFQTRSKLSVRARMPLHAAAALSHPSAQALSPASMPALRQSRRTCSTSRPGAAVLCSQVPGRRGADAPLRAGPTRRPRGGRRLGGPGARGRQ